MRNVQRKFTESCHCISLFIRYILKTDHFLPIQMKGGDRMFLLQKELFEQKADMLLYALEEGIVKDTEVLTQMQGLLPEDTVQMVLDYGDIDEICEALLAFEEEPAWTQNC